MIINPFEINENIFNKKDKINKASEKYNLNDIKIDMFKLQKYVVTNHIEYLKKDLKEELKIKIYEYLYEKYSIKNEDFIEKIISNLYNKIFGYDILQKYIENEEVTDIRAVKYNLIYIKKRGKWEKIPEVFESDKYFEEFIRYTVLKNNGNINFDIPIVIISDKKYNLRVEAGISPANSISASIVIRIHRPNKNISLENLFINYEMLDSDSYKIINSAIGERKNIIISGKGGSGKTSLLRAIIDRLPDETAITTNEETTELYIDGKNIIQREVIESREDKKKITLQKLMQHTLVMSNDVIIVGELKGEETSSFLDSISTGHMGLATVHSDSARNTLDRLVTLLKRDIRNQQYKESFLMRILSSSIDYIIYISKYEVMQISRIYYDIESEKVLLKNEYLSKKGELKL